MAYTPTTITENTVKTVVKETVRAAEPFPMNMSFHELGLHNADLVRVQQRLAKVFNKTVSTVFFTDTIYTLTERLNGK